MKHFTAPLFLPVLSAADDSANTSTNVPGLAAFRDFVKREPEGEHRFTAHVPAGAAWDYPPDAANYIKDYWGAGREATSADFPLLRRGPFGNAIRIVMETDADFRPFLFMPSARCHDTPLDIKGAGKSISGVVRAIHGSGNHALAVTWHEGTDLKQKESSTRPLLSKGGPKRRPLHHRPRHPQQPQRRLHRLDRRRGGVQPGADRIRVGKLVQFIKRILPFLTLIAALVAPLRAASVAADVCIYGGTSAGVVAAVQVAKLGKQVVLVEPGQHLGGMSVEGLGGTDIDNHPSFQNSPAVGGLALEFYRKVSAHYGREKAFDHMVRTRGKESRLWRFEPHAAEAVIETWVKDAGMNVLRGHRLKEQGGVSKDGARITSLHFENNASLKAEVFIDATYEGDLLAAAGIRFVVGREGNAAYAETKNGIRIDTSHGQFDKTVDPWRVTGHPESGLLFGVQQGGTGLPGAADASIQGYCFRLCLTKDPANRLPIGKPAGYDPSHYELHRRYLLAGGLITPPGAALPNGKTDPGSWHHLAGNLTGWNHDYPTASHARREEMKSRSRDYIQGLYWFMAHDEAVPAAQREAWAAWGLCKDEFTDHGGWPRAFYVRNGRRMISPFVLTEAFLRKTDPRPVTDSVGLIWWPPDLHHARRIVKDGRVWNEGAVFDSSTEAGWIPCGIPFRCLVPDAAECTNLLSPTCPSSSYVAYGAYRIEFTFMTAAQSAATAAVLALEGACRVQDVPYPNLRAALLAAGQVLEIPADAPR